MNDSTDPLPQSLPKTDHSEDHSKEFLDALIAKLPPPPMNLSRVIELRVAEYVNTCNIQKKPVCELELLKIVVFMSMMGHFPSTSNFEEGDPMDHYLGMSGAEMVFPIQKDQSVSIVIRLMADERFWITMIGLNRLVCRNLIISKEYASKFQLPKDNFTRIYDFSNRVMVTFSYAILNLMEGKTPPPKKPRLFTPWDSTKSFW